MSEESSRTQLASDLIKALKDLPTDLPAHVQKARCLVARDAWLPQLTEVDRRRVVRFWNHPDWTPERAVHQVELVESIARRAAPAQAKPNPEVA